MKKLFAILGSYWLCCLILIGLMWLTIVGTLSQAELGLHKSQIKYFDSWVVFPMAGPWHFGEREYSLWVPFPGGQALLMLLGLNILVGGFLRFKYSWSRVGITITHVGIVLMLLAGLVKYWWSSEGQLRVWEGRLSNEYVSYHEHEIAITEQIGGDRVKEYLVPGSFFQSLPAGRTKTFTSRDLPFDLVVTRAFTNCAAAAAGPFAKPEQAVVDGVFLRELPPATGEAFDVPGLYATVEHKADRRREELVFWCDSPYPHVVEEGGKRFAIDLRRAHHRMPFTIRLDRFVHELHPRTTMAASYESFVTKLDAKGGAGQQIHIEMNKPLRDSGLILFQSDWGPKADDERKGRYYSVFSVVENPSDQWPLVSCIVIALGLLIHFTRKLALYVGAELDRPRSKGLAGREETEEAIA